MRTNSTFTIFSQHPDVLIGQALTLRYKPVDLDVLPLYISLVAASPLVLWCLLRRPNWTLLGSILLYIGARVFDWNFASYPPGTTWYFNPFAWQLMFVFAAWCGVGGVAQLQSLIRSRAALIVAFAWIAFAFLIVMTWHVPFLDAMVPKWMIKAIYPIDKTDLDMLRFTHFLALALVVARYFPRKSEILTSKWLRPMVLCGQHSLPLFCFGVFLSFGAHWILVQYSHGVFGAAARQRRRHPDHGCACVVSGSGQKGPQSVRRYERGRSAGLRRSSPRKPDYSLCPFWRSASVRRARRSSAALRLESWPTWLLCCASAGAFSSSFCPTGWR